MKTKDKDEVLSTVYEPTGEPEYEHDFYNMTNKQKARDILDKLLLDYFIDGGEVTKIPTKGE